jgi:hypothetical protein
MLTGELREEYKNKLNEIIDFFKTERDKHSQYYNLRKEDHKFHYRSFLSVFALLIAASIGLISLDDFIGSLLLMAALILIAATIYMESKTTMNIDREYFKKSIRYDSIIQFLQHLKITQSEVDLSPLINKINQYFVDNRIIIYMEKYDDIWINEIIDSIDIIINEKISKRI